MIIQYRNIKNLEAEKYKTIKKKYRFKHLMRMMTNSGTAEENKARFRQTRTCRKS